MNVCHCFARAAFPSLVPFQGAKRDGMEMGFTGKGMPCTMPDEKVRSLLYQLNITLDCFSTNFVGQSRPVTVP